MTSEVVREIKVSPTNYPYMMKLKDRTETVVVMFFGYRDGVVVHSDDKDIPIGKLSHIWAMELFSPFIGTIELTQGVPV